MLSLELHTVMRTYGTSATVYEIDYRSNPCLKTNKTMVRQKLDIMSKRVRLLFGTAETTGVGRTLCECSQDIEVLLIRCLHPITSGIPMMCAK